MKLPVYSGAGLSRTVALVDALFLTAVSTSAVARVFGLAATQNKDYPTVQALRFTDSAVAERGGPRRGHRAQSDQRRVDREFRAGEECAGDAVSVSLR